MNARTIPSLPLCLHLRLYWIFRNFGSEGLVKMDRSKRSKWEEEEHIYGKLVLSIEKLQEIQDELERVSSHALWKLLFGVILFYLFIFKLVFLLSFFKTFFPFLSLCIIFLIYWCIRGLIEFRKQEVRNTIASPTLYRSRQTPNSDLKTIYTPNQGQVLKFSCIKFTWMTSSIMQRLASWGWYIVDALLGRQFILFEIEVFNHKCDFFSICDCSKTFTFIMGPTDPLA